MNVWKVGVVAGIALVASACTRTEEADTNKKAAPATAVEIPKRKPGLWKQTMLIENIDAIQTVEICLDVASDAKLAWWGQQGFRQACSKNEVKRQRDGSWTFNSVCEGAGVKTVSNGAAVGDFNTKYQLRSETTTTGAPVPEMNGARTVTIDAQWLGECPVGMNPGDMNLPNGQRVNMLEMSGQK